MHPYFQFPEPLVRIIEAFCLKRTGYTKTDDFIKKFSPEIKKLSDLFNQRGSSDPISSTLASSNFPIAYLAYFFPANFFKIAALMLDFQKAAPSHSFFTLSEGVPFEKTFRVLDLGAGPGTHGLGLLDFCGRYPEPYFKNRIIDYLAVDQDQRQLDTFSLLYSNYFQSLEPLLSGRGIQFRARTLQRKISTKLFELEGPFDLIILGNVVNEMIQNGHSILAVGEWMHHLMSQITPDGALFIIEPALKKTSRNLLALRNLLVLKNQVSISAPCLHQHSCPILGPNGSEKDWCHQEKEWEAPGWTQKIDREIGNRKDALKYSYLILTHPGKIPAHPSFRWRAVSEIMTSKGKKEAFLCNETGRIRWYLLDRECSESNRHFSALKRGDLLEITRPKGSEESRIRPDWEVIIHREQIDIEP